MKTFSMSNIKVEQKARKNGNKHYIVFNKEQYQMIVRYFGTTSPSEIRDKILVISKANAQIILQA